MNSSIKPKINLLALGVCATLAGWFIFLLGLRYYCFKETANWEEAYNVQILWGILHGTLSPSLLHAPFFADHFFFLSFLIAPLYWIWPDPVLLHGLLVSAFFAGVYVLFLILKKHLHPFLALGGMLAYTFLPANVSLLFSTFNYEVFAVPLIFLIFKGLDDDNYPLFIIACIFLCLVKEQFPLVVMCFGVLVFFLKKKERFKWGGVVMLGAGAVFILEMGVLLPLVRKGLSSSLPYWSGYYGQLANGHYLGLLFSPLNVKWYKDLLGPWGVLALFSPQILLPDLPLLLKCILSSNPWEHNVAQGYWYSSMHMPFIYLAGWNTLNRIQGKWRLPVHLMALALMCAHAFWTLGANRDLFKLPAMNNRALANQYLLEQIPADASVLSGVSTLIPLANREKLYPLTDYLDGRNPISGRLFKLPEDAQYLIFNAADDIWSAKLNNRANVMHMADLNFGHDWQLKASVEDEALYVKNRESGKGYAPIFRLIERGNMPLAGQSVPGINIITPDRSIILTNVQYPKTFPKDRMVFPVSMYFKSLKQTQVTYNLSINITSHETKYYTKTRAIGSSVYPTCLWRQGEYVKENYFYLLPPMPAGNYVMSLSISNQQGGDSTQELKYNFKLQ